MSAKDLLSRCDGLSKAELEEVYAGLSQKLAGDDGEGEGEGEGKADEEATQKSLLEREELAKSLDEAAHVADRADPEPWISSGDAFDRSPEVAMAKSMDAGEFVGGMVDSTVSAIDRVGDLAAQAGEDIQTVARATVAVGTLTKSMDTRMGEMEGLLKSLVERMGLPDPQPKGATTAAGVRALSKSFGQPGTRGGEQPLSKALVMHKLDAAFDAEDDVDRKGQLGTAIERVAGSNDAGTILRIASTFIPDLQPAQGQD